MYKIEELGFECVDTKHIYKKVWGDYNEVIEIHDGGFTHYRTRSNGEKSPMFTRIALLEAILKILKGNPQGE